MTAVTLMKPTSFASLVFALSDQLDGLHMSFGERGESRFLFSELTSAESSVRDALMHYEAQRFSGLDEKGQVAFLIGGTAYYLLSALAALYLGEGVVPSLEPDRLALQEYDVYWEEGGESGTYKALSVGWLDQRCWAYAPHSLVEGAIPVISQTALQDRLRSQLEQLYQPLIVLLHQQYRLSKAAQWRLIADALAAAFMNVGRALGCEAIAKQQALQLIRHPGSLLMNRQTDFFDIELRDPDNPEAVLVKQSFRARGGCCRYYTSDKATYCTTCVLLPKEERDARLQDYLEQQWGQQDD